MADYSTNATGTSPLFAYPYLSRLLVGVWQGSKLFNLPSIPITSRINTINVSIYTREILWLKVGCSSIISFTIYAHISAAFKSPIATSPQRYLRDAHTTPPTSANHAPLSQAKQIFTNYPEQQRDRHRLHRNERIRSPKHSIGNFTRVSN